MVAPIKGLYERLEDAFYHLLDTLDSHGIPVYRVHDWLDDHGIPPFPFFLFILTLLVGGGVYLYIANSVSVYNVTVAVYDPSGAPLPGATVTLLKDGQVVDTQSTGVDGVVTFTGLPAGEYEVEVSAEGFKKKSSYLSVGEGQANEVEIELSAADARGPVQWGTLTLFVTDAKGEPVPGADVLVLRETGTPVTLETNDGGVVQVQVPVGDTVTISVSKPTYEKNTIRYRLTDLEASLQVVLHSSTDASFADNPDNTAPLSGSVPASTSTQKASLTVKVIFAGKPVSGAMVSLLSLSSNDRRVFVTSNDGTVTFPSLAVGDYQLTVTFGPHAIFRTLHISSDSEVVVDLTSNDVRVSSQVLDENGNPVENGTADVGGQIVSTDENGRTYVSSDNTDLTSEGNTLSLDMNARTNDNPGLHSLTVRAVYNGKPLPTFIVYLKGPRSLAGVGRNGVYTFPRLSEGTYTVIVKAYNDEAGTQVELKDDVETVVELENPTVKVYFQVPVAGTLTVAGKEYDVSPPGVEIELNPGVYPYTFSAEGYYPYNGELNVYLTSNVSVSIPSDALVPDSYLPAGSSPEVTLVPEYGGAPVPVLFPGGKLRIRVHVPKVNSLTVKVSAPSPVLSGSTEFSRTYTSPPPVVDVEIPLSVPSDLKGFINSLSIKVSVNGSEQTYSLPFSPWKPVKVGSFLVANLPENGLVEAPNGAVDIPLLFVGDGNVLLRYDNTEENVVVKGYAFKRITFTTELPTKAVLTFFKGGAPEESITIRIIPKEVFTPPLQPTIEKWYLSADTGGEDVLGTVALPVSYLYVKVVVPENTTTVTLHARIGSDLVPVDYAPHFVQGGKKLKEVTVSSTPDGYTAYFIVPIEFTQPYDIPDVPLEFYVEATDRDGAVTRSDRVNASIYASHITYTLHGGTTVWYSVSASTTAGDVPLVVRAFSPVGGGTLSIEANTDAEEKSTTLNLSPTPQVASLTLKGYKYLRYSLDYLIAGATIPITSKEVPLTLPTYTLKVCVSDDEGSPVEGASVSVEGYDTQGNYNSTSFVTFSDGCGSTDLPRGDYTVTVTKEGYVEANKNVSLTSDQTLNLVLIPTVSLPSITYEGLSLGGSDAFALVPGKTFNVSFRYALRPDEPDAYVRITSMASDLNLCEGSDCTRKEVTFHVSGSGQVTVAVLYTGEVVEPLKRAAIAYDMEVNEGGTYTSIVEPDVPQGKLLTLYVVPSGDTHCNPVSRVGALVYPVEDGVVVPNAFDGDRVSFVGVVGSCGYEGSGTVSGSVGDTSLRGSFSLRPHEVVQVTLASTRVSEGTYNLVAYAQNSAGVDLFRYSSSFPVYGPNTLPFVVKPDVYPAGQEVTISVYPAFDAGRYPNLDLSRDVNLYVAGGPGAPVGTPVSLEWNGTAFTGTVNTSPSGGEILVSCEVVPPYSCASPVLLAWASRDVGGTLSYFPTKPVIPIAGGYNSVDVKVKSNFFERLVLVGKDVNCNLVGSNESWGKYFDVSVDVPEYLSPGGSGTITISVTRLSGDYNVECDLVTYWRYAQGDENRVIKSVLPSSTSDEEINPTITLYVNGEEVKKLNIAPGPVYEVNAVVDLGSNVAPFVEEPALTPVVPTYISVRVDRYHVSGDRNVVFPLEITYNGPAVPSQKVPFTIKFRASVKVGYHEYNAELSVEGNVLPVKAPLAVAYNDVPVSDVWVVSFNPPFQRGSVSTSLSLVNETSVPFTVTTLFAYDDGTGWSAYLYPQTSDSCQGAVCKLSSGGSLPLTFSLQETDYDRRPGNGFLDITTIPQLRSLGVKVHYYTFTGGEDCFSITFPNGETTLTTLSDTVPVVFRNDCDFPVRVVSGSGGGGLNVLVPSNITYFGEVSLPTGEESSTQGNRVLTEMSIRIGEEDLTKLITIVKRLTSTPTGDQTSSSDNLSYSLTFTYYPDSDLENNILVLTIGGAEQTAVLNVQRPAVRDGSQEMSITTCDGGEVSATIPVVSDGVETASADCTSSYCGPDEAADFLLKKAREIADEAASVSQGLTFSVGSGWVSLADYVPGTSFTVYVKYFGDGLDLARAFSQEKFNFYMVDVFESEEGLSPNVVYVDGDSTTLFTQGAGSYRVTITPYTEVLSGKSLGSIALVIHVEQEKENDDENAWNAPLYVNLVKDGSPLAYLAPNLIISSEYSVVAEKLKEALGEPLLENSNPPATLELVPTEREKLKCGNLYALARVSINRDNERNVVVVYFDKNRIGDEDYVGAFADVVAAFLRDPASVVFQATRKENGGDAYDLLLFGVSSGGGVSGSLSYVVPVLLLAGDCPGLGTYLVDVSEVCGNGCGISAVVGDTGSLEGLDAPGGYTLLDAWENSGEDKAKVLLIAANNHYYLALRPKAIEENAAVTVVLRHPTTRGITSTPVRITLTPNAVTPGLLHDALTEALSEDSPQSAQIKFQESLLTALTHGYNSRVHPVLVPPTASDTEARNLVKSALLSCGGGNTIPVKILDRYNTLKDTLRLLVTEFDLGRVGSGSFALCLGDEGTREALGLENACYGKYIDEEIVDRALSNRSIGSYALGCAAATIFCEAGRSLGVAALLGAVDAAFVCGIPAALGFYVRGKAAESVRESGSALSVWTALPAAVPAGYLVAKGLRLGDFLVLKERLARLTSARRGMLVAGLPSPGGGLFSSIASRLGGSGAAVEAAAGVGAEDLLGRYPTLYGEILSMVDNVTTGDALLKALAGGLSREELEALERALGTPEGQEAFRRFLASPEGELLLQRIGRGEAGVVDELAVKIKDKVLSRVGGVGAAGGAGEALGTGRTGGGGEATLPGGGEQTISDTGQEALERTTKFNLEKFKEIGCPIVGMIAGTITSYLTSQTTPLSVYTLTRLDLTLEDNVLTLGTVKIGG